MTNFRNALLLSATCVSLALSSAAFAATPAPAGDTTAATETSAVDSTVKTEKKAAHKGKHHVSHKAKKAKDEATK